LGRVASLNNEPDQLVDEAVANLTEATVACPEMLARLADELMDTDEEPGSTEGARESICS
jgi:hypothetical protein